MHLDLVEMGKQAFVKFREEFASYGIECDPETGLHKGTGMLCFYDFNDRQIYLSMPDFNAPTGKLQMLMFRQMLSAETNDELMRFLGIFIPFVVAHEMTHHFRHRYGLFSEDSWHEEQLANKLASAVNKYRIPPAEREFAVMFLERAMQKLGEQLGITTNAFDSYYDITHSLQTSDQLSDIEMDNFRVVQGFAPEASSATMMLRKSRTFSKEINQRLENRRALISSFNETYAADQSRYIYYQVGWVYLAMKSAESNYVDEFARDHLNMAPQYMELKPPHHFDPRPIYACYKAFQQISDKSETISRYFYKRYRAYLLGYLKKNYNILIQPNSTNQDINFDILSIWDDRLNDPLDFLAGMVPPILREIFPNRIAQSAVIRGINLPQDLPAPEERDLWDYAHNPQPGISQKTVHILQQFESLDIFRSLPTEAVLDLSKKFYTARYATGETLVWQNENNSDIFVLVAGKLEASIEGRATNTLIQPGEVFGEIAWLTNSTRVATVHALVPSTCYVIKESDLKVLAYKNPSILMSIAGTVARRFRETRNF